MTTDRVMAMWGLFAFAMLVSLVTMSVYYQRRHQDKIEGYARWKTINRIVRWTRILACVAGVVVCVDTASMIPGQAGFLIAPGMWALLQILVSVVVDLVALGRVPGPRMARGKPGYLPIRLMVVTIIILGGLVGLTWLCADKARPDQRSLGAVWIEDGAIMSQVTSPFAGLYYTSPMLIMMGAVVVASVLGLVTVRLRPRYLPEPDWAILDRGLRRRTARDIVMAVMGAASMCVALIAADVAWAVAFMGADTHERTAYTAVSIVVAVGMFACTCWCVANFILLSDPVETFADEIPAIDTPAPEVKASEKPTLSGTKASVLPDTASDVADTDSAGS